MDPVRFDTLTKFVTRRAAARGLGVGGALAALGVALRPTVARDATPPAGAEEEVLFVQTFASGAWSPKPGSEGAYLLVLAGAPAHTVYFADRPERDAGTLPTDRFLGGLGFGPEDPPNAAVVAQGPDGEVVLVVELLDPVLEPAGPDAAATLTYEARPLAAYAGGALDPFASRRSEGGLPASFGTVSLFIDGKKKGRGGGRSGGDVGAEGFCEVVVDSRVFCLSTGLGQACAVLGRTNMDICGPWYSCGVCGGSPTDFCERNVSACRPREKCHGRLWADYCHRCLDPTGRAC